MTRHLEGFKIIIIDDNTNHRLRLKQVLSNLNFKCKIEQARSESEGYVRLERSVEAFDCVFISSSVPSDSIGEFVLRARRFPNSKKALFLVCLAREHYKGSDVARFYLDGADGFISEPYSADQVQDLILITHEKKSKENSSHDKMRGAFDILVTNSRNLVSSAAMAISRGQPGQAERKAIRDVIDAARKTAEAIPEEDIEKTLLKQFLDASVRKGYVPRKQQKTKIEEAIHPGDVIKKIMSNRKFSEEKIRGNIKIDPEIFDALLNGQGTIDEFIARELSRVLGNGSSFWMEAQKKYDRLKPQTNDS